MVAREEQREQRHQRDDGEQFVVAAKETPRRAGVAPVDEFEKAVNEDAFLTPAQQPQHEILRELIQGEDQQRDGRDATAGRARTLDGSNHSVRLGGWFTWKHGQTQSEIRSTDGEGHIFAPPPNHPRWNSLSSMKWRRGAGRGGAFSATMPASFDRSTTRPSPQPSPRRTGRGRRPWWRCEVAPKALCRVRWRLNVEC